MRVERQFFEQAADRVIRTQEITVGGARLVLRCEHRAVLAGVKPVDDVHGPHAQCDDLLGAVEAGEDYVKVAPVACSLCVVGHDETSVTPARRRPGRCARRPGTRLR